MIWLCIAVMAASVVSLAASIRLIVTMVRRDRESAAFWADLEREAARQHAIRMNRYGRHWDDPSVPEPEPENRDWKPEVVIFEQAMLRPGLLRWRPRWVLRRRKARLAEPFRADGFEVW